MNICYIEALLDVSMTDLSTTFSILLLVIIINAQNKHNKLDENYLKQYKMVDHPLTDNMSDVSDDTFESSDSDDDLLGITNDPIHLKTIYKPTSTQNPEENFQSHPRQIKNPYNMSEDGWIYCGKNRRSITERTRSMPNWRNTRTQKFTEHSKQTKIRKDNKQSPPRDITSNTWNIISTDYLTPKFEEFQLEPEYNHRDIRERTSSVPTMEIIDLSTVQLKMSFDGLRQSKDKINKYQRMREIRNISGFIVNVHDATNFDIDLDIVPELHERYRDVISNQYTYQDLGEDFLENPDMNRLKITPEVGTTYRCRLKGVGINQLPSSEHTWKSNQMCVDVKQLIDRTDGWVTCTLSDIDVYQRLLVDIVINTNNGPVNLRDYLLIKMRDEDSPIFYPYSSLNGSKRSQSAKDTNKVYLGSGRRC